jgi:hypothetical protein
MGPPLRLRGGAPSVKSRRRRPRAFRPARVMRRLRRNYPKTRCGGRISQRTYSRKYLAERCRPDVSSASRSSARCRTSRSPYNVAYYQLQTYCENGASIVPNSLISTWSGTSYNGTPTATVQVTDTCQNVGQTSAGQTKCFSKPQILPVAYRLAEVNEPVSVWYSVLVNGTTLNYTFNITTVRFNHSSFQTNPVLTRLCGQF